MSVKCDRSDCMLRGCVNPNNCIEDEQEDEGIDSLRRALSVADERVREQAEEIEAHKRARLALGEVLAEIAGIVGVDPKRQSGDELIAEVRRIVDARQTTEGRHGH